MFTKQLLCALFQLQGLSLWSKTPFLTGGGGGAFKADGEPDIKYMNGTNKYRITVVVSASCAPGLAQHWHRTSGR